MTIRPSNSILHTNVCFCCLRLLMLFAKCGTCAISLGSRVQAPAI